MPTTIGESLPRLPQCAVEDLDVRRRTLALMRDVTVRPEVREAIDALGQRERRNQWLRTDGRRGSSSPPRTSRYSSPPARRAPR